MCFEWISEQTVTFTLYIINRLVFITEVGVFTARYALSPYVTQIRLVLRGLQWLRVDSSGN